jgi:NADH oxidase (H2O2-forming)
MDRFFREVGAGVKRMVVVGGGFIGMEFADEIAKRGIEVHLVEHHPHVLSASFDRDACLQVQTHLANAGIQLHTSSRVQALEAGPDGAQVAGVLLEGGERIGTDAVLIAAGTRPNVDLAEAMGLAISDRGGILVDAVQRTPEDPKIFAVGDCASKQDFFTRRPTNAMLRSRAAAEGRIAGISLYALHGPRFNADSIAVYASQVGDLVFGVAGLTEAQAGEHGFLVYRGEVRMPDHHPSTCRGHTRFTAGSSSPSSAAVCLGDRSSAVRPPVRSSMPSASPSKCGRAPPTGPPSSSAVSRCSPHPSTRSWGRR